LRDLRTVLRLRESTQPRGSRNLRLGVSIQIVSALWMADRRDEREFRLAMVERAIHAMRARVDDLARSLGELTGNVVPGKREPFTVDASNLSELFGGFYRGELDSDSRPFRWTGKSDFFEFRLNIDRNVDWRFRMFVRFAAELPDPKLVAFADFIPIKIDVTPGGIVTGTIPRQPLSNQLCLTFHCNQYFSPKELDPASQDNRMLALSFYEISFSPIEVAAGETGTERIKVHEVASSNE
jgi:hypothetical protein